MNITINVMGMDALDNIIDWLTGLERAGLKIAVEEEKWEPDEGETYYYFTFQEGAPLTARAVWRNGSSDHLRARLGNVFETEEAAWKFASGVSEDDR